MKKVRFSKMVVACVISFLMTSIEANTPDTKTVSEKFISQIDYFNDQQETNLLKQEKNSLRVLRQALLAYATHHIKYPFIPCSECSKCCECARNAITDIVSNIASTDYLFEQLKTRSYVGAYHLVGSVWYNQMRRTVKLIAAHTAATLFSGQFVNINRVPLPEEQRVANKEIFTDISNWFDGGKASIKPMSNVYAKAYARCENVSNSLGGFPIDGALGLDQKEMK